MSTFVNVNKLNQTKYSNYEKFNVNDNCFNALYFECTKQ
mgnify:CR=1 FL=1